MYVLSNRLKKNIKKVQNADIIISAVGKPGLITDKMIKNGVVIIDGGITKKGKKVLGDVNFESVKSIASYITPVPGGVGPVTIACLLRNTYLASKI
jgi:methylenetetrahydrofolate dehydrogenase (NADP+)/methenyltetrahydrofolate cyclohydrolase